MQIATRILIILSIWVLGAFSIPAFATTSSSCITSSITILLPSKSTLKVTFFLLTLSSFSPVMSTISGTISLSLMLSTAFSTPSLSSNAMSTFSTVSSKSFIVFIHLASPSQTASSLKDSVSPSKDPASGLVLSIEVSPSTRKADTSAFLLTPHFDLVL